MVVSSIMMQKSLTWSQSQIKTERDDLHYWIQSIISIEVQNWFFGRLGKFEAKILHSTKESNQSPSKK